LTQEAELTLAARRTTVNKACSEFKKDWQKWQMAKENNEKLSKTVGNKSSNNSV
jgi:hypothetical protein